MRSSGCLVLVCTWVLAANAARAGYLIDDFTEGVPFDTVYGASTFVDAQGGLDAAHVLGGQRAIQFGGFGLPGGSAHAVLDTVLGQLSLDSIQGGDLGGGGIDLFYGEFSIAGTDINFDLSAFAGQRIEVTLDVLAAGDTKGPQPGITWRTNIHSRDLVEVTPGNFEIVDHFTNVDVAIANTAVPVTTSLAVDDLFGGAANPADLVGMAFNFIPIGTGGDIVISRIEIVPEPSTMVLLCVGVTALAGARIGRRRRSAAM